MKYTWLVEKYLEGELSGEALRKFELEILRKPEVAEEVERVRSMHHFLMEQHSKLEDSIGLIEDYEDSENVIDEEVIRKELDGLKVRKISAANEDISELRTRLAESKIKHTLTTHRSNKVLVRKVSVWLAAASVAVLMVISFSLATGKSGTGDYLAVIDQYYFVPHADIGQRDITTRANDSYDRALELYNDGKFADAFQHFTNVPEGSVSDHLYLYMGIASIELGEYQAALNSFSKLLSDDVLKHYGMWYSGISLLLLEDIPKAREIFEEIVSTDGQYKKEAKKMLKSI